MWHSLLYYIVSDRLLRPSLFVYLQSISSHEASHCEVFAPKIFWYFCKCACLLFVYTCFLAHHIKLPINLYLFALIWAVKKSYSIDQSLAPGMVWWFVRSCRFEALKGFAGNLEKQLQLLCIFWVFMTYTLLHSYIESIWAYIPMYLVKQIPEKLERKKLK